jgi:hypothetical protein
MPHINALILEARQITSKLTRRRILFYSFLFAFIGCIPAKENPKYLFSKGAYNLRSKRMKEKVYLVPDETQIKVFNMREPGKFDTSKYFLISLADNLHDQAKEYSFVKGSFDLDVISLPLKFRPSVAGFPAQLNTSLNGGIFLGRRSDIYMLKHRRNELGIYTASLQHYGLSFGVFTGIGSAAMNPWVSRNNIQSEYDAVVCPFGINTLFGLNNLTFGAAVGLDHMFSSDRKFWIYKNKPWLGLTVGLNLN